MKTSLVKDVIMEFGFHYGLQIPLWVESVFVNHLISNGVKMSLFMCQRQNDSQWASYIILTQRSSHGLEYSLIVAKKSKAWEKILECNWETMKNIAQKGRQKHSFFKAQHWICINGTFIATSVTLCWRYWCKGNESPTISYITMFCSVSQNVGGHLWMRK